MLEKDKGEDDFASAQNATPVDVCISAPITLEEESKEKEKKNSEEVVKSDDSQTKKLKSLVDKETCKEIMSKEDIKDEYQENEKEIDARDYEDREMPEKIVNDISSTEQEEYIKEVKPIVETNEENDVSILTPTESYEETTNDEFQENEKELNISEQDQGNDEVTCSQDPAATSEVELQSKFEHEDAEHKLVKIREIPKEYNEVIQTSGETEGKMEQQIQSKK
nr:hypothetical protein [Tanacetum cinerariifolium]